MPNFASSYISQQANFSMPVKMLHLFNTAIGSNTLKDYYDRDKIQAAAIKGIGIGLVTAFTLMIARDEVKNVIVNFSL